MSRSRCLLHLSKLEAFQKFCESQGWLNEPIRGDYERLRMTKEGSEILIVYARLQATEHATVHGIAEQMARAFLSAQRQSKRTQHGDLRP